MQSLTGDAISAVWDGLSALVVTGNGSRSRGFRDFIYRNPSHLVHTLTLMFEPD